MDDTAGVTAAPWRHPPSGRHDSRSSMPVNNEGSSDNRPVRTEGQLIRRVDLDFSKRSARACGRIHSHNCIMAQHLDGSIEPMLKVADQRKSSLALKAILGPTSLPSVTVAHFALVDGEVHLALWYLSSGAADRIVVTCFSLHLPVNHK
jgi:hypothetical protein